MIFGPAGNRGFLESGRPRGLRKPFKNMGGEAPRIFEWFPGPPGPPRPQKSTISGWPKNHVLKTQVYESGCRVAAVQKPKCTRKVGLTLFGYARDPGMHGSRAYRGPGMNGASPVTVSFRLLNSASGQEIADFEGLKCPLLP